MPGVRTAVIVALALPACRRGPDADPPAFALAVGWRGSLLEGSGPCEDLARVAGSSFDADPGGGFVARRPGTTRVRCQAGTLRVEVRAPDRVRVRVPRSEPMRARTSQILTAEAADARGTLDVGRQQVEWTLAPPLREGDRCDHMLGSCLPPSSVRAIADAPGEAVVAATIGGLRGTATVRVVE